MNDIMSSGATIVLETAKFLVPFSKSEQTAFNEKEEEYATARGWEKIPGFDLICTSLLNLFSFDKLIMCVHSTISKKKEG